MAHEETIRELIHAVRRRWATLRALRAAATGAVSVAIVFGAALLLALGTHGAPRALAIMAVAAVVLSIAAVIRASWALRGRPEDRQVARFIEERVPALEDRLVSAVDLSRSAHGASLADLMLADAANRVRDVEPGAIAAAALVVVGALVAGGWNTGRQALDAVWLTAFP